MRQTLPRRHRPNLAQAGLGDHPLEAGAGRFALLTGIGGEAWVEAAHAAAERLGIAIDAFLIGPGRDLEDPFGDWSAAREVGEAGCVLVRPDMHVAWRAQDAAQATRLADVLARLLGRDGGALMLAAE